MRIEKSATVGGLTVVRMFDLLTDFRLDPVNLILRDDGGCGQVIAECYGQAWATYFGSFGGGSLIDFLAGVHPEYLSGRFEVHLSGIRVSKATRERELDYRNRVCRAVVEACKSMQHVEPMQGVAP